MTMPNSDEVLTADTITDKQIRELREALFKESGNQMTDDTDETGMALQDPLSFPKHLRESAMIIRNLARARCAEIINISSTTKEP